MGKDRRSGVDQRNPESSREDIDYAHKKLYETQSKLVVNANLTPQSERKLFKCRVNSKEEGFLD